jgi:hypothetical protein
MPNEHSAERDQKSWQVMEQNQTHRRGDLVGIGSNQPKPRVRRRQTAQSTAGAGASGIA